MNPAPNPANLAYTPGSPDPAHPPGTEHGVQLATTQTRAWGKDDGSSKGTDSNYRRLRNIIKRITKYRQTLPNMQKRYQPSPIRIKHAQVLRNVNKSYQRP